MMNLPGEPLSSGDLNSLAACGISPELAEQAGLRRVDSATGGQLIGRNGGSNYAGIAFPYCWPGENHIRDFRLRRDVPDFEYQAGVRKEKGKYLAAPGRSGMLYMPPGISPELLNDSSIPVFLTEGEKKSLSLHALAWHGLGDVAERPRWLAFALPGVWNFRGKVGKETGPNGDRHDVKGVISDFDRITWKGRKTTICFDNNAASNSSVQAAQRELAKELTRRGAKVFIATMPSIDGVNGVDDLIGLWGSERVLELLSRARPQGKHLSGAKGMSTQILMEDKSITKPELLVEGLLPACGLVLFGGRPKEGKSWFACQLALSIVSGEDLGGWLKVKGPRRCHLWALEDGLAITKDKVSKLMGSRTVANIDQMMVFPELPKSIIAGGDDIIRATLDERPTDVVIFDSLFKLTSANGTKQTDITQRDYDVLDTLRKIALEYKIVIVVIMHTRKGARGGNPIENLLGTTGTTAVPDAVCELARNVKRGKLTIVGRSVPGEDYELQWHAGPDQWGWTIEAQGDDAATGETGTEVLSYLEAQGSSKPATIATALHRSFGSVWMALQRLHDRGLVTRRDKTWEVRK